MCGEGGNPFWFEVDEIAGGRTIRLCGDPGLTSETTPVEIPLAGDVGPGRAHRLADRLNDRLGLTEPAPALS